MTGCNSEKTPRPTVSTSGTPAVSDAVSSFNPRQMYIRDGFVRRRTDARDPDHSGRKYSHSLFAIVALFSLT